MSAPDYPYLTATLGDAAKRLPPELAQPLEAAFAAAVDVPDRSRCKAACSASATAMVPTVSRGAGQRWHPARAWPWHAPTAPLPG